MYVNLARWLIGNTCENMKPGHTFERGVSAIEKQQGAAMEDQDPQAIQAALTVRALHCW